MHSAAPVSYLFVPATRPERFDKALAAWLSKDKSIAIRINSADTKWFADDLALCARECVAEIILPKAGDVADVKRVVAAGAKSVNLLIESALGIKNIDQLAQQERVTRLIFGSIDFCVDMGIDGDDRELDYFRSHIVIASRLAELAPPVDGVTTAIDDVRILQADTLRGKRFGFGAKLCIHPKQVAAVNAAYRPTPDELAWARRVMDAAGSADGAAVQVDGRIVDKPVLIRAQRLLAQLQK